MKQSQFVRMLGLGAASVPGRTTQELTLLRNGVTSTECREGVGGWGLGRCGFGHRVCWGYSVGGVGGKGAGP